MQGPITGLTAERTKAFLEGTIAGATVTIDDTNPAGPGSVGVRLAFDGRSATKAEITVAGELLAMASPGVRYVVAGA